jgi:hypothetical protein
MLLQIFVSPIAHLADGTKGGAIAAPPFWCVQSSGLLCSPQPEGHGMLPNAGQQVRGDRAERGNDQGRVQERPQQIGHERVGSAVLFVRALSLGYN